MLIYVVGIDYSENNNIIYVPTDCSKEDAIKTVQILLGSGDYTIVGEFEI